MLYAGLISEDGNRSTCHLNKETQGAAPLWCQLLCSPIGQATSDKAYQEEPNVSLGLRQQLYFFPVSLPSAEEKMAGLFFFHPSLKDHSLT